MTGVLRIAGLFLIGIGVLIAGFVWLYAPLRAKTLDEKYAQFRAEVQPTHDAIDAQFNHQDRVVNGIQ